MIRRLVLALLAVGAALFAASLLRTEGDGGRRPAAPAGPRRCGALTRSGGRCSRPAEPGSDRCWQHR